MANDNVTETLSHCLTRQVAKLKKSKYRNSLIFIEIFSKRCCSIAIGQTQFISLFSQKASTNHPISNCFEFKLFLGRGALC